MNIISYAQNFEDVMLWRALDHLPHGFHIDVGDQQSSLASASKAFYEQGWRGVRIDAIGSCVRKICEERKGGLVIQAALSNRNGSMLFYDIPESGLLTGEPPIAARHRSQGLTVLETAVDTITLDNLFEKIGSRDVHWLKIDVGNMEQSGVTSAKRPWNLAVESTYPSSQIATHFKWRYLSSSEGYTHQYFDGLNRYIIANERIEISQYFKNPTNSFGGFQLAHSSTYNTAASKYFETQKKRFSIIGNSAHRNKNTTYSNS